MRILSLLLIFLSLVYSNNLKRDYTFTQDGVYINDVIPNQERIKLFDIKDSISRFNVKSFSLIKRLREYNISINNIDKISNIAFNRKSNFDDTIIIDFLKEKFLEKYEEIEIINIEVKPLRNINMANMIVREIIIAPYALQRNKGSFKTVFDFQDKQKTIFYNFKINATLAGIKLTKNVSREETFDSSNTKSTRIQLSSVNKPLSNLPPHTVSARNLRKNHILSKFDIKKEYLVRKNSHLEVSLNLDGIEITSYFEALENGYINDNIKIQNTSSGKTRFAKVVGKSKVLLR